MTGDKLSGKSGKTISDLLKKGDELLELLEELEASGEHEHQKNRNMFVTEYNKWYAPCLSIIRNIIPDNAMRFESLYHTNKRSGMNEYTYTIQDYIRGIYFKDKPKSYTDAIVAERVKEQKSILQAATLRTSDFSFDMEKFVKINPIQKQSSSSISKYKKFIDIDFSDEHYNSIRTEINSTFRHGLFTATLLLSRELIRNLLIDMIRMQFPPTSDEHIALYHDPENETYKEIRSLLKVLEDKKDEFEINPEAIDYLVKNISVIEPELKPESHSLIPISRWQEIEIYNLEEVLELLTEIIELMEK